MDSHPSTLIQPLKKTPESPFIDQAISNNLPMYIVLKIASFALAGYCIYQIRALIYASHIQKPIPIEDQQPAQNI